MTELLLPTKLAHPQIRPGFISRPRLIEQLNAGLDGTLTLFSAPAGFGKTTALTEWINHVRLTLDDSRLSGVDQSRPPEVPGCQFAWLSLDDHDNEPARFWAYVVAALQTAAATLGQAALSRLQSTQPTQWEPILALLIHDLSQLNNKLILVLDDYHLINNPAIHTGLAFLLEHLPPQLHLVIASRSDPPLSLSRWRVRGVLTEVRAADLRFTVEETTRFLHETTRQPFSAETVTWLTQRTEGWAAGLQLAALSLRELDAAALRQFMIDFGGTHRHIYAYLMEEIWQRQPVVIQQFLLQTTILSRLGASLCDAVTKIREWQLDSDENSPFPLSSLHAQLILDYLATNNLFLIPLDESGRWYRYHTLFTETLQARLQETQPDLIPELHRRAGRWYEAHGHTEQAIRHALAAPDYDMAADLIDAAANRFWLQGHHNSLLAWLTALPEETILSRLRLCLLHAWLLFIGDRWAEASWRIHLAGQRLATLPTDHPEYSQFRGRWAAIQGAMAAHRQDAATAIAWMETALENLPSEDIHWRQVAMIGLGLAQLAEGQAHSAITTFHGAALVCEQNQDLYLAFAAWSHQAEACWAQGCLHEVAECLHRLELLSERDEGGWLALPAYAAIWQSTLAYERNELAQAEQLITTALPQIWPGGQPRVVLMAYLTLARLAQAQGHAAVVNDYLAKAEQVIVRFNLVAERIVFLAAAARLLLAQGQLMEAYWKLEQEGIGPESPVDFHHEMALLSLVRLYLADGRAEEATTILGRLLPPAELTGRQGSLLEISLLQALAAAQRGHHDRALVYLRRSLTLAEPERYVRIFLNEGRPLSQLLRQITPQTPYVSHLLAEMAEPSGTLNDLLTSREQEILTLVAHGASNQVIADELIIGLGTVKGHLNHILSKLDAHNRTEAVARGRELGLL